MKFTKANSVEMYGIAILLMVFHHLFKSYIGPSAIQTIAYFGKICVAIFAFISGYGLSVISEKFSLKEKVLHFYVLLISLVIAIILSKAEGVISNFWLKEKTS